MAYQHGLAKGDDASTIKLYGERTSSTSCKYFTQYVSHDANILDIGCGPGQITADLARLAPEGKTIGVDNSAGVIDQARSSLSLLPADYPNLSFAVGDINSLSDFTDNTFDVVHAHQVLLHIPDPIPALKEMYRVCKPGAFVAVREATCSIILSLQPDIPAIREYWDRAMQILPKIGGHPLAGRELEGWAKEAGYEGKIIVSKTPIWQAGHLERCSGPNAEQGIQYGFATNEDYEKWGRGWAEWEAAENHEWVQEGGEIVCWKGQ